MPVRAYAAHEAKGKFQPFNYEPGPLGPDDVEVRVTHCGICHSDMSMLDNEWGMTTYPLVAGHEAVGEVIAKGAHVKSLAIGDRVGVGWQSGSCEHCRHCGRGQEHLCLVKPEATIVGRHGGFAETVRCSERWATPIPKVIESRLAGPLMCAGTTVWTPMRRYGVRPGMKTAVVGIGGLGHLAVQFLAKMGTEVTAISSSKSKEDEARQLGASDVIATRGTDDLAKAANRFDFILSTVSADLDWNAYINALAPGGVLCIAGVPASEVKFQAFPIIAGEKQVVGGRLGAPSSTLEMLDFCASTGIRPWVEEFPMTDVNAAMDHLRAGKARYRVVLTA